MDNIFEGNINFSEELLKLICDNNEKDEENQCLISGENLTDTSVELRCGHKFNYNCLLNELKNQRKKNNLEIQKTSLNQIKCPYCRKINNGILPWYEGYEKIKYINWSKTNTKIVKRCISILKSGKRKGKKCNCKVKEGDYCGRHK